jgi:long-chain acyl-CoA synthetase
VVSTSIHPKIADAVTIGVPDEYRGETVKVFVVLKPGETLTEEEVIAHCKEKLANSLPTRFPVWWSFARSYPRPW